MFPVLKKFQNFKINKKSALIVLPAKNIRKQRKWANGGS